MNLSNAIFYSGLFGLGALDSLEPGHGKALVLSFFTGSHAKAWHIVFLGVVVTLTHIAMNGVLAGLILYFAAPILENDQLFQLIELLSGIGILLFAGYLCYVRFFRKTGSSCCGSHGHHHNHDEALETSDSSASAPSEMSLKQVTVLGLLSGLAPCPVVLTALVSAILVGQGQYALQGIAAFSLGYGAVIMGVGFLTLFGTQWMERHVLQKPGQLEALSRWSVVGAFALGAFFVTKAIFFHTPEGSGEEAFLFYPTP